MRGENGRRLPAGIKFSRSISRSIPDRRDPEAIKPPSEGSQGNFWGDAMTGLGSATAISASKGTGTSSNADFRLAVTNPTGMPISVSCIVLSGRRFSGRLAARMACAFTTGIRGTAPPPLG